MNSGFDIERNDWIFWRIDEHNSSDWKLWCCFLGI